MRTLPVKSVRKAVASKASAARWAKYHAELAAQGITPREMRLANNRKRVERFRAKQKAKALKSQRRAA